MDMHMDIDTASSFEKSLLLCRCLVAAMPQWNFAAYQVLEIYIAMCGNVYCCVAVCGCIMAVFSIAVSQLGRGVTTELPMGDSHAMPLLRLPCNIK